MDLKSFREDLITDINWTAKDEDSFQANVFIDYVSDILVNDYAKINQPFDSECYFEPFIGNRAYKSMQLDAGNLDLVTNSINLLICDYNEFEIESLNNEFINDKAQKMVAFCENCLKGFYNKDADESLPVVQLARDFVRNVASINKIKLFLISTNELSSRIKTIEQAPFVFSGKAFSIEYEIVDINTIYNVKLPTFQKEDIEINVKDFKVVIPCIKAQIETDEYESYLAIVPGIFLAEIYNKIGSRLLEDNVRSFLNVRGAVNKGIRGTILNERPKFFTYNNGIATTAKEIVVENVPNKGLCITKLIGFQIINGGQTTASLASAMIKDKADLSGIYVQMKLTVIKNYDPEMISLIAKYSNTQNKVNKSEFSANHPFYKRMEDYSHGALKIMAPMVNGCAYQTIWFFERARGQYEQPKFKMTKSEKIKYDRINPKNQKFTKTDLAKYINTAEMFPYKVAWGSDVNAVKFQELMEKEWDKNEAVFNDLYFKSLVAKAILFKHIERLISDAEWYKEFKAYRAEMVTYTFALFIYHIKESNKYMNYRIIWDKQSVPEEFDVDLKLIAKLIFDLINDSNRPNANIREYCKSEICWKNAKLLHYIISDSTMNIMWDEDTFKFEEKQAKKNQSKLNLNSLISDIFNVGYENWKCLKEKGIEQNILKAEDIKLLNLACEYCKFQTVINLTSEEASQINDIERKLEENGITCPIRSTEAIYN